MLDPASPLLELKDAGLGASPRRFRGTTLYDWMRAGDSASRVLSVSRKDRGAILPVGRSRGDVFWYAGGIFTTSAWYRADTLPGWVREWNAAVRCRKVAGWTWNLLLTDPAAYPEPDSIAAENGGRDIAFPHQLTPNIDAAAVVLPNYPVMDSLTLAFALRGVERMRLGQGPSTDLLVVSLSSTDAVGHGYGPDSRELHDQVLQLDRWLGRFLDSLWAVVPRERTLLALTADHGIASMPEYISSVRGRPAGRLWFGALAAELNTASGRRWRGVSRSASVDGVLYGDVAALGRAGVSVDSVARAVAARMKSTPGVRQVFTPGSLKAAPPTDADAVLCRRTPSRRFRVARVRVRAAGLHLVARHPARDARLGASRRPARPGRVHGSRDHGAPVSGYGEHHRHRADPGRPPRRQADRAARRPRAHPGGSVAGAISDGFPPLPCFPCPHGSSCCAYGVTLGDEEAAAISQAHGEGTRLSHPLG